MFYVCVLTAFWDKNCICDIHFYVFVSFGKASVQFSLSEITKMGIEGTERWGNAFISSLPSRSYLETEKWNKISGTHFISVRALGFIAWESQSHILDTNFLWCLYPSRNRDQHHYSLWNCWLRAESWLLSPFDHYEVSFEEVVGRSRKSTLVLKMKLI